MRKPDFCIRENKGAEQLHSHHAADQRFCFPYLIENPKTGFLAKRHNYHQMSLVMRKLAYCIYQNKDANQLRGNCEADQRLLFSLYG